jgi:hypothetical protein
MPQERRGPVVCLLLGRQEPTAGRGSRHRCRDAGYERPLRAPRTSASGITGATIIKAADDADHGILAYGEEGTENGLAGGTINGGSIQANCNNPAILGPGGTITLSGVALSGNKITATGGVVLVGV